MVQNSDETVDLALVLALECLHETRKSDSVIFWLRNCEGFNQRECVGILKTFSSMSLMLNKRFDAAILALLQHFSKTDGFKKYEKEIAPMLALFDTVLTRDFFKMKQKRVAITTYLKTNLSIITCVLNSQDLQAVLGCAGEWVSVAGPLRRFRCIE